MTVVTIDKKKYVIVPEKQFKQLQKKAAGKNTSQKLYSLAEGKAIAYKMIEKWAAKEK